MPPLSKKCCMLSYKCNYYGDEIELGQPDPDDTVESRRLHVGQS